MAKLNIEVNVTGAKDVKTLEKSLKQLETSSTKVEKQNNKTEASFKSMAVKIAAAGVAIYGIQKAMRALTEEGFSYNNALEQAEQGLIALSVAAQDKAIPVIERYANATKEAGYSLAELQKINANTPHTLNQTNQIYKAMYISMRNVGATTDEMINLTEKLSIASGAAGIEFNSLLAGVDGLATGTVLANSDLGRFLNGLGLTNTALKETEDVVQLLNDALNDFEAADTMQVALSNLNNAWSIFAGNVTKPIFDGVKKAMNEISVLMSEQSPKAVQVFSDALVDFANAGIKSIGFVIKAVNQLIGLLETSYAGYVKLAGLLQSGSISEAKEDILELQRIQKEGDYGYFSNQSYNIVQKNIKAKKEEIEAFERANEVRREGERIQERAKERTEEINKLITDGVDKIQISYGEVSKVIEDLGKPLETVFKPISKATSNKIVKGAKDTAKNVTKAYEREADKLDDMFTSVGDSLGSSISNALGPVAEEIHSFYQEVQSLMLQASKVSQAQSQAEGTAATGPAVAKAGAQAGLYGSIAMAGLLSAFGLVASGSLSGLFGGGEEEPPELEDQVKRSESMKNSLEAIEDVQYPMLALTRDMKGYLGLIANSFGNIENSLIRSDRDFAGDFFQENYSTGALGFSSKEYSLYGTTLDFEAATIADIIGEQISVERNTIIKKVYDSFWKTKVSYFDNYEDVSDLFAQDLADATDAMFSGFTAIGQELGVQMDGLIDEVIDIGLVDTTGKSPQEIAEEIEGRFSAQADAIAEEYLGFMSEFQLAGEGLAETAFRVTTNMDQVQHGLGLIGLTLEETSNEYRLVLGEFVDFTFTFTTQIYELTEAMLDGAGGIDALNLGLSDYMTNFFSEQEQYEMQVANMSTAFNTLGLELPSTNEEFRALAEGIDINTEEGARLFGELITLSGSFAEMTSAADDLVESLDEVAEVEIDFESINDQIADYGRSISSLLLGKYSNLSITAKEEFARGYSQVAATSNGVISYTDALRSEMELAFKYATSQEEYGVYVDRLVTQLKSEVPEATNDDIVERLDTLIIETREMNESIKMTS